MPEINLSTDYTDFADMPLGTRLAALGSHVRMPGKTKGSKGKLGDVRARLKKEGG
jgi:hypothetical protein